MDKPTVSLRPVTPSDEGFLLQVYASTRREEMAQTGWSEGQIDAFLEMQYKAQRQHYREHYADASFDVILVEGRAAGRLYLQRRKDEHRIVDIALLPEFRGQGIGRNMLADIIATAAKEGKVVRIHVERNNPALRLYQRLGFVPIGDSGVYFLMERPL